MDILQAEMSAIFGELLTFSQESGADVKLRVYGDRVLRPLRDGRCYSVIYDQNPGYAHAYALLADGAFVSSGIDLSFGPPPGAEPHLEESDQMRSLKAERRFSRR